MMDRLAYLWPEIALFIAACVVMVVGISPSVATRKLAAVFAGLGVIAAGILAWTTTPSGNAVTASSGQVLLPSLALYAKVGIAIVALLLLLLKPGTVDRAEEAAIELGVQKFDALRTNRAEFYSFFLFSLMGLMLCAGADDLIWLFLALELTSLPTYIMVAISGGAGREPRRAGGGVKYFFLGALGAAIFLYGFALIYGATGSTNLNAIHSSLTTGGVSGLALAGLMLSDARHLLQDRRGADALLHARRLPGRGPRWRRSWRSCPRPRASWRCSSWRRWSGGLGPRAGPWAGWPARTRCSSGDGNVAPRAVADSLLGHRGPDDDDR
jgi:NADH:ubiquinone oxidoreductase subunit 2 (subunit N)